MAELSEGQRQVVSLRIASEFLSPREACLLVLLNKYFAQHYLNDAFKEVVTMKVLQSLPPEIEVQAGAGVTFSDLLYICSGFKNLVKNPCGEEGFAHWEKRDGGSGWVIEDWPPFRNHRSAFISSYEWCTLKQSIDLGSYSKKSLKNAVIVAGAVACARFDCGGVAQVIINTGKQEFKTEEVRCPEDVFLDAQTYRPITIAIVRTLQKKPKSLELTLKGKDTKWWAGQYGARFLHAFVHVIPIPPGKQPEQLFRVNA